MICGKARQTLGLLYRQFYGKCDSGSLLKLYISLVRPHLEYACPVWAPHSHKDIHLIERVQMFGVKIISGEWNAAYHDCLGQFGLVTLERRRLDLSLCLLYKYVNSMCYFHVIFISQSLLFGTLHLSINYRFIPLKKFLYHSKKAKKLYKTLKKNTMSFHGKKLLSVHSASLKFRAIRYHFLKRNLDIILFVVLLILNKCSGLFSLHNYNFSNAPMLVCFQ